MLLGQIFTFWSVLFADFSRIGYRSEEKILEPGKMLVFGGHTRGCTWLKSEENEEARRLLFNPEEPRIRIFRAREEFQKKFKLARCEEKNKIKD